MTSEDVFAVSFGESLLATASLAIRGFGAMPATETDKQNILFVLNQTANILDGTTLRGGKIEGESIRSLMAAFRRNVKQDDRNTAGLIRCSEECERIAEALERLVYGK